MNKLLCLFCVVTGLLRGQTISVNARTGACITFKQHLYIAGLNENAGKSTLAVYKFDPTLKVIDSLVIPVTNGAPEDYQRTVLDTLHGHLNVYVQKKGSAEVRIVRLTPQ